MLDFLYQSFEKLGYTHPLHPTQVNMVVGLVVTVFALLAVAGLFRRSGLVGCARSCALAALLFLVPTIIAGVMDWQRYFAGAWIYPIKLKMGLAALLFVLLPATLIIGRKTREPSPLLLAVCGLSLATVTALGYLGAELVFAGRTPPAPPEYRAGRELFRANCSGCHPYGANIVEAKHHLWSAPVLAFPQLLRGWLRKPEAPMPAFSPARLSDEEIEQLFSYLNYLFYQRSGAEGEERHHP